ncbi:MAG: hypothetical protein N7Q72_06680, partial [Spiroplasma sp. Tabriz.8]|nr:hypothetical protein [Spiroplasma sp. Tabriz.8]
MAKKGRGRGREREKGKEIEKEKEKEKEKGGIGKRKLKEIATKKTKNDNGDKCWKKCQYFGSCLIGNH